MLSRMIAQWGVTHIGGVEPNPQALQAVDGSKKEGYWSRRPELNR